MRQSYTAYCKITAVQLSNIRDTLNLNVMYMFLQHCYYSLHTHTHTHTHKVNLNDPPVLLQMQPATSSHVGSHARDSTTSTSEEHSVMDPTANVVSTLVLKHARMSSSVQ
jgi:hypothetical protein